MQSVDTTLLTTPESSLDQAAGATLPPGERPLILHVEVGGSLGGSLLSLATYLKHCDAHRFRHEIVFYQRPPHSDHLTTGGWPCTDLGLWVPGQPRRWGDTRHKLRPFLQNRQRFRRVVVALSEIQRLIMSVPPAIRLARYLRRSKPALVHCGNSFPYQVPTVLGAWLARKPLICHFRTMTQLNPAKRWLARLPVYVVAINQTVARELQRQGVRTQIAVCHNPIEVSIPRSAKSRRRLRDHLLGDGELLVGSVTRLDHDKGVEDLLVAAHRLHNEWPGLRYAIIGDGPKADELCRLAKQLSLENTVRFLGFRQNVFDYLACFDIFVSASLKEGGPRVVLEAMRTGTPTISTRVGMVPELIRSGENGLIIERSNPEELARSIALLVSDPELRHSMGRCGASDTHRMCDPDEQARKLDEIFARTLGFLSSNDRERGSKNRTVT